MEGAFAIVVLLITGVVIGVGVGIGLAFYRKHFDPVEAPRTGLCSKCWRVAEPTPEPGAASGEVSVVGSTPREEMEKIANTGKLVMELAPSAN